MTRTILALVVLVGATIHSPGTADAAGPGVHLRECSAVLDDLVASDPEWAALVELPLAKSYALFGALSPDFDQASDALTFGHSRELSYHLLDAASDTAPEFKLFALGHLCHQGSDAAMHSINVAPFFASAAIGIFSLFGEYTDGRGDSEGIVESLGDLVVGDWLTMVDVLYDFWFEDETAKERAAEVLAWYCATGAEFLGKPTNCAQVQADLESKLAKAEPLLGAMSREEAKEFMTVMLASSMEDLIGLAMSGGFTSMLSGEVEKSAEFDSEVERLKQSVLVDKGYWTLYDSLFPTGVTFTRDLMAQKTPSGSWPSYDGNAVICGNIQSVMNYLPGIYKVKPGLTVDEVTWQDAGGMPLSEVAPEQEGKTLQVAVTLFSALPLAGKVTGIVRGDQPWLYTGTDPVLGKASVDIAIDPAQYITTPRTQLTVQFEADPQGLIGFYLEMYLDDEKQPWLTTSWDRLWFIEQEDSFRPIYRNNFGTYGHWPPSLPLAEPADHPAPIFVKVREAPDGPGIQGALVVADLVPGQPDGPAGPGEGVTGTNGVAIIEMGGPAEFTVTATADGYEPAEPVTVQTQPLHETWVELKLLPVPQPDPGPEAALEPGPEPSDAEPVPDGGWEVWSEPDTEAWTEPAPDSTMDGVLGQDETGSPDAGPGRADVSAADADLVPPKKSGGCSAVNESPVTKASTALLLVLLVALLAVRETTRRRGRGGAHAAEHHSRATAESPVRCSLPPAGRSATAAQSCPAVRGVLGPRGTPSRPRLQAVPGTAPPTTSRRCRRRQSGSSCTFPYRFDQAVAGKSARYWIYLLHADK